MSDAENPKLDQAAREKEAPQAAPPAQEKDPAQVLSPKRRSALVTYLAILFAVAFLFVALTMALEARRLKNVYQELQDSSQKTSASLTGSINALQAENQALVREGEELRQQIEALEEAARTAETEKATLQGEIDRLTGEKDALAAEKEALTQEAAAQAQRAQDAVAVSELLQAALAANEEGDLEALAGLLEQIEPLRDLLSLTELELYESLIID